MEVNAALETTERSERVVTKIESHVTSGLCSFPCNVAYIPDLR